MYAAPRRVKVHNIVSDTASGTNGLAAGCAYAKDILEGYLTDIKVHVEHGDMGIYVDDVTLSIEGDTAKEAACLLNEDLATTKGKLQERNMVLNDKRTNLCANQGTQGSLGQGM